MACAASPLLICLWRRPAKRAEHRADNSDGSTTRAKRNEVLRIKTPEDQRANLKVMVLRIRLCRLKNITDSPHGVDHFLGEAFVELVS